MAEQELSTVSIRRTEVEGVLRLMKSSGEWGKVAQGSLSLGLLGALTGGQWSDFNASGINMSSDSRLEFRAFGTTCFGAKLPHHWKRLCLNRLGRGTVWARWLLTKSYPRSGGPASGLAIKKLV